VIPIRNDNAIYHIQDQNQKYLQRMLKHVPMNF